MILSEQFALIHTWGQKLGIVNFAIIIGIDWIHNCWQFFQGRLIFLIFQGCFKLLDGELAVMVEVDLFEEIAQVLYFFLGELGGYEGGC